MTRLALVLLTLAVATAPARAQSRDAEPLDGGLLDTLIEAFAGDATEARTRSGVGLVRQALAEEREGRPAKALESLMAARVEDPGSPLVAQAKGDVHAALAAAAFEVAQPGAQEYAPSVAEAAGHWEDALEEYARGARDGYEFRSAFNSGVVRYEQSEALLKSDLVQAKGPEWDGVVLVPSNLPGPDPEPEILEALEAAIGRHRGARLSFLRALAERADADARESVAAINRRLDELEQMRDELAERKSEEQEGDDGEQGDESDESDEQQDDEQQQDQQDGQDQQQQDGQDDQQQPQDQQGEDEPQPPPEGESEAEVAPAQLTPQQLAELMDKLEELEQVALELQRRERENARQGVEKDW